MSRPCAGRAGAALRARRAGAALRTALRTGLLFVGALRIVAGVAMVPGADAFGPLTAEREANQPPVAADDRAAIDVGATIDDPAPGLLFNDVDPDGDPLVAMRDSGPANGTAIVRRDGSWTYSPAAGFVGIDSFTYVASDGLVTSLPATVSITVRGTAATATATAAPVASPSASPVATSTPSPASTPSASPTLRPVPAGAPPAPPGADAFSIPEPPATTFDLDHIGLEASEVAGLGPILWWVPTVLLGVPGVLLLLAAVGKAGRSRRLAARRARPG